MALEENRWLRRWQLIVDTVLYVGVAALFTLIIGGMSHCTAETGSDCIAFTRYKVIGCSVGAILIFPFWFRRKLKHWNGLTTQ
jgi:hypothetical protein